MSIRTRIAKAAKQLIPVAVDKQAPEAIVKLKASYESSSKVMLESSRSPRELKRILEEPSPVSTTHTKFILK